jgi:formylglycine-generating enzyme required for sulfatase activity
MEIASAGESFNDKLARQQANGAVALLRMNQPEKVWPLLKHSRDPSVRSYLIDRLSPLGADAKAIVKQLDKEADLTIRRALLLSLGEFTDKEFTLDERVALLPKLQEIYRKAADPGLHAASEWLLRLWKDDAWLRETDQAWAKDKQQQLKRLEVINEELKQATSSPEARWYVNGQGQTLVVIPGPVEFWMGSPPAEAGRFGGPAGTMELRHWQRIGRSYALASKKVTAEQFRRFRQNHPMYVPTNDCPAAGVSWHDAAAYCNWLSEQEGIPKEEWCYEPEKINFGRQTMKMTGNYLQRTGYRVPTEAEWEFACRAGAATRFSFGESEELLPKYGWFITNSQRKSQPVGILKPNDLGLFDMHGDMGDQCHDVYKPYGKPEDGRALEDLEDSLPITLSNQRVVRGGGFFSPALFLRSAQRTGSPPTVRSYGVGFRPARTLPLASVNPYAAARTAALAAAGQGKDQPPLDEAAKAKLRRQALDGLKTQLTNWNKIQPPRLLVIRTLRHWQRDSGLAGIRDEGALAKLPAAEQQVFTQLWADVARVAEPANSAERLEFVRAAVLGVAGKNEDEPPLDETAKTKLRGEALDWLKVALTESADRAGKATIIAVAAPLPGLLEKLAESAPKDGPFQAELARHYAEQGNLSLANAARTKARPLLEKQLVKEPENADLAADLADLLLIDTTRWTVLTPTEMKSSMGATLTLQEDRSVFVSGIVGPGIKETYTLDFKDLPGKIQAIRLEALRDDRLPQGGPGTNSGGNFVLSHLAVSRAEAKDLAAMKQIPLRAVFATFEERPAESSLTTADKNAGWSVQGATGRSHIAIFALDPDHTANDTNPLRIVLDFYHPAPALLGRFRCSVSSEDPSAIVGEQRKRLAATKTTDPWLKLGAAYARDGRKDEATHYFGRALQQADGFEAKKIVLELAALFDDLLPALAQRRPDDLQLQLALARKLAERGQQLLAAQQPAKAQAELQKSREAFTRLRSKLPWSTLTPIEMKSTGGETLTLENDGSIFVSGPNPERAIYTLKFRTDLPNLTAIRLETIPDARLQGGAGRFHNGNFHLAEFTAAIASGKANGPLTTLVISSAFADTQADQSRTVKHSVDGNPQTLWDTNPKEREPHWAVFVLKSPARMEDGFLIITLDSGITSWGKHGLGRFRLSVTNEADVLTLAPFLQGLKESEVVDLNLALAKAHAQQGQNNEAAAAFTRALALVKDGAGKARIITEAAPLKGMLENLAESVPHDGPFQAALARHFAGQGKTPLANSARMKAHALFEAKLAKEPENAATASDLADLLFSANASGDHFWIDDAAPSGATPLGDTPWEWVSKPDHPVFRGHKAMRRQALGLSQHYFVGADTHLKLGHGAKLFAYVFLDPKDPPKTVMLQFHDGGNWEHRAFWGDDLILWGTLGKESRLPMGPLPKAGEWVRLEVEAARVGLQAGAELHGRSFTQHGGTCYWDAAGTTNCTTSYASPWLTLAIAYAVTGKNDRAVHYASKAMAGADDHDKKAILEHMAGFDKIVESLVKRHPAEPQFQLAHARNLAVRGQKALASKKPAEALAPWQQAQDIFARLLAPREAWTMLKPVEMRTENGSKLELQKDGSIFVDQPAKKDNYTLVFETDLKGIKGMRLEALPDSRLPFGGPGWNANGNFVLSQLSLHAAPALSPDQPRSVGLRNAAADFSQSLHGGWDVRGAVDGKGNGWAIEPEFNQAHTAVFEMAEEIGDGQVIRLTVQVSHQFDEKFLLGRFRLSFTTDAATLPATRIRWDLKESEVVDVSVALAKAHAQAGQSNETAAALARGMTLTTDHAAKFKIIATAATLAAAGKSPNAPSLDDAANAKLRRQVLDGLKAELIILTKQLESAPPAIIVQTLDRWQKDPDLASIRDAAALAKLSAGEHAVFTQLWADVAALLKRAQEKPK